MSADPLARRPDEIRLYSGVHGDEHLVVFLSRPADRLDLWRCRILFADASGVVHEEHTVDHPRTNHLSLRLIRQGGRQFVFRFPSGASTTSAPPSTRARRRRS